MNPLRILEPTYRRPLGETISEIALGIMDLATGAPARATGIEMSLPVELRLSGDELLGDLPLYRRATAFDPEPARLSFTLWEVPR